MSLPASSRPSRAPVTVGALVLSLALGFLVTPWAGVFLLAGSLVFIQWQAHRDLARLETVPTEPTLVSAVPEGPTWDTEAAGLPFAVVVLDRSQAVVLANAAFEALQFSPSEIRTLSHAGHEINRNGRLYTVHSTRKADGTSCIALTETPDHHEVRLALKSVVGAASVGHFGGRIGVRALVR